MNDGFLAFKKKIIKELLIKSLMISLGTSLIIFGILLILNKLLIINLNIFLIIGISLLALILIFIFIYFVFKPTDEKIAKRLDHTFGMNEKVQTMIAFKDDNNFIVELQRENTNEKLKNTPLKLLRYKISFIAIVLMTLGLGSTIASISIPTKSNVIIPDGPIDPSYTLTEKQIMKIQELIKYVNNSKMLDSTKDVYVEKLNYLIDLLEASTKESEMKQNVLFSISEILVYMKTINTNVELGDLLKKIEPVVIPIEKRDTDLPTDKITSNFIGLWRQKDDASNEVIIRKDSLTYQNVSKSITKYTTNSIEFEIEEENENFEKVMVTYKFTIDGKLYKFDTEIASFEKIEKFEKLLLLGSYTKYYSVVDNEQVFTNILNDYSDLDIERLNTKVNNDIDAFSKILSELTNKEDVIYTSTDLLIQGLKKVLTTSDSEKLNNVISSYNEFATILNTEMTTMKENRDVAWHVEDVLRELFGLEAASNREYSDPDNKGNNSDSSSDNDGNGGNTLNPGGIGKGDSQFGSDDKFYDIFKKEWDSYGKYYGDYTAFINDLLKDDSISEEMKQFIKDYLAKLLNNNQGN